MDPNVGKRQNLITYSQADLEKFPTRESFGQSLEVAFNAREKQKYPYPFG